MKGEAYFIVTKDPKHPFMAKTAKMEIKVLGTQFNVNAFEGQESAKTTLVEGRLEVISTVNRNSTVLTPGQQASVDQKGLMLVSDVDTKLYTDWIDGKFIFVNERLEDIVNKLSRYNIEVEYADERKDICFGARLNRHTQVNAILK